MRTDLNKIVQDYKISKKGGARELESLKRYLSNVPVSVAKFEEYLDGVFMSRFTDLIIRAELCNPQTRDFIMDNFTEPDESEEIEENMAIPYPIIMINGESLSKNFYEKTRKKFSKLVFPVNIDASSLPLSMPRVFGSPNFPAIAIIYKKKNKIGYIEMILTQDRL